MKKRTKIVGLVVGVIIAVGIGLVVKARYFTDYGPDMHSFFDGVRLK